ncbi:DUF1559 domain-containing protein [Singulisphaera sp. PoT]|uniref:DUF1559 family PulG-like putative transporter n=1 Tax=Singulisphaera sp. PoT TaxID=3411797 RepID=UPI003BF55573
MWKPRILVRWLVGVALVVILLVGGGAVMERVNQSRCRKNLQQLGLALTLYASTNRGYYPSGTIPNPALPPERRLSWMVQLGQISMLGAGIELQIDPAKSWDDRVNLDVPVAVGGPGHVRFEDHLRTFPVLVCPVDRDLENLGTLNATNYIGIGGLGEDSPELPSGHRRAGVFGYDRITRQSDIKDGLSATMAVVETARTQGGWTAGGLPTLRGLDEDRPPYLGKGGQFGGLHRGGVMVAFADGSVRFLRETIDPRVFESHSTIAGRETIPVPSKE